MGAVCTGNAGENHSLRAGTRHTSGRSYSLVLGPRVPSPALPDASLRQFIQRRQTGRLNPSLCSTWNTSRINPEPKLFHVEQKPFPLTRRSTEQTNSQKQPIPIQDLKSFPPRGIFHPSFSPFGDPERKPCPFSRFRRPPTLRVQRLSTTLPRSPQRDSLHVNRPNLYS
jgi:hypothetical protein